MVSIEVLMKRYQKYSKYWYPHIVTLIRLYPSKLDDSEKSKEAKKAITKVLLKTIQEDEGIDKIKTISELYFYDRKTAEGVAQELYVSKRKVGSWVHDFVFDVANELGYTDNRQN